MLNLVVIENKKKKWEKHNYIYKFLNSIFNQIPLKGPKCAYVFPFLIGCFMLSNEINKTEVLAVVKDFIKIT